MTYLVVGTRSGDSWSVDVQGIGTTTATDLAGVEAAARVLLATSGVPDAADVDLQLLLPDFEVDLDEHGMPRTKGLTAPLIAGLIALVVVVGAIAFVLGQVL